MDEDSKRLPGSRDFRLGLYALVPKGASVKAFEDLFDGRAKISAINHWRYGERHIPRWARELLAEKLERHYQGIVDTARRLRAQPDHPGLSIGRINLAKWKVEQAKKKNAPAE